MRRLLVSLVIGAGLLSTTLPAAAESYRVRPGDTISGIARQHGVTTAELLAANSISDPDRVIAGRTLVIPPLTHVVQPGDVLSRIARRYGVSTASLASANGISNADSLRAGQVLRIRAGATPAGRSPAPVAAPPAPAATGSYVVQRGDVLSVVARRLGTTTAELLRLNGLSNPDHIRSGQVLVVPSGATPAPAAAPRAAAAAPSAARRYPDLPARLLRTPERLALIPSFERWSATYGLPVELLMALSYQESGWRNTAVSSVGALGVGQLLPTTAAWLATSVVRVPSLDPANPDDNIRMSAAFLSWLHRQMGGREPAIAAYFQGPASVRQIGLLPQTQAYIAGVQALVPRFRPA